MLLPGETLKAEGRVGDRAGSGIIVDESVLHAGTAVLGGQGGGSVRACGLASWGKDN